MSPLILFAGFLLAAVPGGASSGTPPPTLVAYSPGGPHHALVECAELFRQKHGVSVAVIKASHAEQSWKLPKDGDLYFGGAEYMLDDFATEHPGVLDLESADNLFPRRIGVVVRKGNPLNIRGIECLGRDDVDLLGVRLEMMSSFLPRGRDPDNGVLRSVYTGQEGLAAWRSTPELDAWVTYKSWHVQMEAESDFIEIPGDHALRYTPVALTRRTTHREEAKQFVAFLKSPEARKVFVEHGWE